MQSDESAVIELRFQLSGNTDTGTPRCRQLLGLTRRTVSTQLQGPGRASGSLGLVRFGGLMAARCKSIESDMWRLLGVNVDCRGVSCPNNDDW